MTIKRPTTGLEVTLRSGQTVAFECIAFSVKSDKLTGVLTSFDWEGPARMRRHLVWANPSEIAAIVEVRS